MWTYRESRSLAALKHARAAWENRSDPLWDGPDPEPDDEPPADDIDPPDLEGL